MRAGALLCAAMISTGCATNAADQAPQHYIDNPIGFFAPDNVTPSLPMFCLNDISIDQKSVCYQLPDDAKVGIIAGIIQKACSAESSI